MILYHLTLTWITPTHSHTLNTLTLIKILYTCKLFLRDRREIFILGVLGFLKTTWSFLKIPKEVWSLLKKSKVFQRSLKSSADIRSINASSLPLLFTLEIGDREGGICHYCHCNFTHGVRSLHGSEFIYFWKLCRARRQQLTFFNQAWEIGPQAWAGVRSKFSTRRRETHA